VPEQQQADAGNARLDEALQRGEGEGEPLLLRRPGDVGVAGRLLGQLVPDRVPGPPLLRLLPGVEVAFAVEAEDDPELSLAPRRAEDLVPR
jgi:hypothetical protein